MEKRTKTFCYGHEVEIQTGNPLSIMFTVDMLA
jgi:hypothetical protein